MPSGRFFHVAETKFGPWQSVSTAEFYFLYVLADPCACRCQLLCLLCETKRLHGPAFIAGALTLSLVTVFYLFTKTLIDLGVGNNVFSMLKIPAYLSFVFAAGLILTAMPAISWYKKAGWLLAGPLFAFLGFMIIEKKVWGETHSDTDKLKADYTVTASALIREFAANDTAANNKYREKILVVEWRTCPRWKCRRFHCQYQVRGYQQTFISIFHWIKRITNRQRASNRAILFR